MHLHTKRILSIALVATLATPLLAFAEGDVKVSLSAHRVTTTAAGTDVFTAADKAKPGETIEYRARYTNDGSSGVNQLVATLPIPAGMQYQPKTAQPALVTASLDGATFAPVPLKRTVRLADGSEVIREVPPSEYRFLRWTLGSLAGHTTESVRARVRVSPLDGAVAERASH